MEKDDYHKVVYKGYGPKHELQFGKMLKIKAASMSGKIIFGLILLTVGAIVLYDKIK